MTRIQPDYSAVITVKSSVMVDIEFTRPLSPETAKKILDLRCEGVGVALIPPPCNHGFWISLSSGWNPHYIAQACLDILYEEGFELKRILCRNFVPNIGTLTIQDMKTATIEAKFKQDLSIGYHVLEEGKNRYRVFTPFQFRNGDHLAIVLKKVNGEWVLSDEGHTYLHLSCTVALEELDRIMECPMILSSFAEYLIENRQQEIMIKIENTGYELALHKLIHVLLEIIVLSSLA